MLAIVIRSHQLDRRGHSQGRAAVWARALKLFLEHADISKALFATLGSNALTSASTGSAVPIWALLMTSVIRIGLRPMQISRSSRRSLITSLG
jgi:hypothetical protein